MNTPWLVIPTYNEKENIGRMISALFALPIENFNILVVDDSSPDGTATLVRSLQSQYSNLHLKTRSGKLGLGSAYVEGFTMSLSKGATQIVQMDADFSHDPADIPRLLEKLTDHDLVLGSRYVNGISVINWPLRRLLLSLGGSWYVRLITGMPFRDATSGFKAWRRETLEAIDLPTVKADGYGFQIIMTFRAWKKSQRIVEVPIIFTERRSGQSKMSRAIVREALWSVWKLRLFG